MLDTIQWVGDIKRGTFTLDKNVSTGRPRSLRTSGLIREVEDLTENDPRMSTWKLAELLHVDQTSIYRILTEDLEIKNVCSVRIMDTFIAFRKEQGGSHCMLQAYSGEC